MPRITTLYLIDDQTADSVVFMPTADGGPAQGSGSNAVRTCSAKVLLVWHHDPGSYIVFLREDRSISSHANGLM